MGKGIDPDYGLDIDYKVEDIMEYGYVIKGAQVRVMVE